MKTLTYAGSYISPSPDLATMVPHIKEKAPPPMHLSEPRTNYAPSPSIVTQGNQFIMYHNAP